MQTWSYDTHVALGRTNECLMAAWPTRTTESILSCHHLALELAYMTPTQWFSEEVHDWYVVEPCSSVIGSRRSRRSGSHVLSTSKCITSSRQRIVQDCSALASVESSHVFFVRYLNACSMKAAFNDDMCNRLARKEPCEVPHRFFPRLTSHATTNIH